jgi:hypothetical protein
MCTDTQLKPYQIPSLILRFIANWYQYAFDGLVWAMWGNSKIGHQC